ncbi:Heavy metal transport/detoxification protein [Clostridium sp. DL-VIII]|uniref:heavy-metal-associated domain-containing protein n=1 Tax=Clostridium sp. DL-VIII TaxID=641107 RepID=UPI00023AF661|nr:heavy metal-associated domain-containing protein [Clostridium sp. DL-VIII]EHI96786.1 Heavy metal transport/detoxification protein [Clostridium sp. DL-VIII]
MATYIISAIIIVIVAYSFMNLIQKVRYGCCGGTVEKSTKKKKLNKIDLEQYKFSKTIYIEGMTCKNCTAHVENELNSLDDVYAEVDLKSNLAKVKMHSDISDNTLENAVRRAGYTVKSIA